MTRTRGATDLKPRKRRSDLKHKYVHRNGKLVRYVPKRQKGDPIKIWFWEVKPMSQKGYRQFDNQTRPYMHKWVYRPLLRVDVPPERLANKQAIEQLALEVIGYDGLFLLKGFSHGKNKFHVKNITLCRIKIVNTGVGLKPYVYNTSRLSRYWFWQKA